MMLSYASGGNCGKRASVRTRHARFMRHAAECSSIAHCRAIAAGGRAGFRLPAPRQPFVKFWHFRPPLANQVTVLLNSDQGGSAVLSECQRPWREDGRVVRRGLCWAVFWALLCVRSPSRLLLRRCSPPLLRLKHHSACSGRAPLICSTPAF